MGDYHPQHATAMKLAGAYINDDTYGRLVALAAANNRTLPGQCRHLFDRALKGDLQVPDAPAAAARKPALRAVARGLRALEANAQPEAGAAETGGLARQVTATRRVRPQNETFPVVGCGVAAVEPVGTGYAATPKPPAAGQPRAAACARKGACCCSQHDAPISDTTPEPNAQHACLCHTPHPLPHSVAENTNEPPTPARRTVR